MRTNYKGCWTWGYVVGRDRYTNTGSHFEQAKEGGRVSRVLTHPEAITWSKQLGEPYYIKRVRIPK